MKERRQVGRLLTCLHHFLLHGVRQGVSLKVERSNFFLYLSLLFWCLDEYNQKAIVYSWVYNRIFNQIRLYASRNRRIFNRSFFFFQDTSAKLYYFLNWIKKEQIWSIEKNIKRDFSSMNVDWANSWIIYSVVVKGWPSGCKNQE